MKKILFIFSALFLLLLPLKAQRVRFELSFVPAFEGEAKVYVMPRAKDAVNSTPFRLKDGKYVGGVPASATGFYDVVVVKDNAQFKTTVYAADAAMNKLEVKFGKGVLEIGGTPENRALSAYNAVLATKARTLWMKPGLSQEELKTMIASYEADADSLLAIEDVSDAVEGFMAVWAYTTAYDAYTSIPRAQNIDAAEIGFELKELLEPAEKVLDNDYAQLFYLAYRIIESEMPADAQNLLDKLEILQNYYQNETVREAIRAKFIETFLSRHNYTADYEGGLRTIQKVTEIYFTVISS